MKTCRPLTVAFICLVASSLFASEKDAESKSASVPRIAAIVTEYRYNSHADVIVGRLIQGFTLNDQGEFPKLKLVSLYADQLPQNDMSRGFAEKHGFRISPSIEDALTLGTGKLAVDGVLLIGEHGSYPRSETGQVIFPKRRFFDETMAVFKASGRVVPVFTDKHLSDNWDDAKRLYDEAVQLKVPLMAGSSLPGLWRNPPLDLKRGSAVKQIVVISYGDLEAYGFHGLEVAQCLVERRRGGETGIVAVQCLEGQAAWDAGESGVYDKELLSAALARLKVQPIPAGKTLQEIVPNPAVFIVDYKDGLRACVFTLNNALQEWAAAWRDADDQSITSTLFAQQEGRPYMHFTYLVKGAEKMMHTGQPTWPVERTLLTTGALHAAFLSRKQGGARIDTPYLDVRYESNWDWEQPPPFTPPRE